MKENQVSSSFERTEFVATHLLEFFMLRFLQHALKPKKSLYAVG